MTESASHNPPDTDTTPLARQRELIDPAQYLMIATPDGWQLLLESNERYLRWVMRGPPGNGGQAWPDTDVAAASLEGESGGLRGKPALERERNENGYFRNLRTRDGEPISLSDCLDDGVLELEFDGPVLGGRWRLTRSGAGRTQAETWTLLRAPASA